MLALKLARHPARWCPDFPLRDVSIERGITHALGSKNLGAMIWLRNQVYPPSLMDPLKVGRPRSKSKP